MLNQTGTFTGGYGTPHILKKNISKLNFDPAAGTNFPFYWAQVGEFCRLRGPYVFWAYILFVDNSLIQAIITSAISYKPLNYQCYRLMVQLGPTKQA